MPASNRCTCTPTSTCGWCEARIEQHEIRQQEAHADDWQLGQSLYEREIDGWGPQT